MHTIPEPLQALVEQLSRLPGIGPKSAMRIAMTLLKWPVSETRRLGQSVYALRDSLHLCSRCGGLTEHDPCAVCADTRRQDDILCIVSEWDSMLTMESGAFYQGQYFILGGLLSPLDNMNTDSLDTTRLTERLAEGTIAEIVLALGATMEAENTASYLRTLVLGTFPQIRISRLAQGIPLGGEVKFMDKETLRQSLKYRQNM